MSSPGQASENRIGFCSAPWTDCITYADGALKACDRNVTSFGNWQENGLKKTWHSEKFKNFRQAMAEGRYPDSDCTSCHNNGTQRTAWTSLGGAFHYHQEYLCRFLSVPFIPIVEEARVQLTLNKKNEDTDRVLTDLCDFLHQTKAAHPETFAEDAEFRHALTKIRVIAETLHDYLHGVLEPRRVATFRQSQLQAKCTARCVMCAGKFTGEIVDGPTMDEKWVDEAFAEPEDITDFWCNGAEYLYYKDWKKIALMLANEGTSLRISTNGILLTEPTIRFMIDNKILRYLTVSFDAAQKETLESTRINVNFNKVMASVRYLLAYAREKNHRFEFTAAFVMMKRNLEELPDFVRLIQSLRPPGCENIINVLCQPLENFDVLNYRRFVHGEHHWLFGEEKLREIFLATERAAAGTGIAVTFYNQKLADFIADGMPFPKYFPRRSDVDILLADLARPEARISYLHDPLEKELPQLVNKSQGDREALVAKVQQRAQEILQANLVLQEIGKEFPDFFPCVESTLPAWTKNFLAKCDGSIITVQAGVHAVEGSRGLLLASEHGTILVEPAAPSGTLRRARVAALKCLYVFVHKNKAKLIGNRKSRLLWNMSVIYRGALGRLGLQVSPVAVESKTTYPRLP